VRHPHHYDPNQPRVPKGHPTGGRWTDGNHGQSTILEEGGRTDGGYRNDTLVQQAFLAPAPFAVPPVVQALQSALTLFAALSALNNADRRAAIAFKAREYQADNSGRLILHSVRVLDRDEVKDNCPKLEDVQKLTDKAAAEVQKDGAFLKPSAYGTAVHKYVEKAINGTDETAMPKNPNFMAEPSFLKTYEETGEVLKPTPMTVNGQTIMVRSGQKGSIRVDVYEKVSDDSVCVYDIKTGRRGLSYERIKEIAAAVAAKYGKEARFIIIEIRPTHPRAQFPGR
jgi:hypothetical protein